MCMGQRGKVVLSEAFRTIEENTAIRARLFSWAKGVRQGMPAVLTVPICLGLLRLAFLLSAWLLLLPSSHDFPLLDDRATVIDVIKVG